VYDELWTVFKNDFSVQLTELSITRIVRDHERSHFKLRSALFDYFKSHCYL